VSRARRTHLFLALGSSEFGEVTLGIRVAKDLERAGDRAVFVTTESAAPLFADRGLEHRVVPCRAGSLTELRIDGCIRAERPASIVLADYVITEGALRRLRVDPRFLTRHWLPIVAIDTWCFRETGRVVDTFRGKRTEVSPWIEELPHRLVPVPVARPLPAPAGACALLPEPVRLAEAERAEARAELGLGAGDGAVLLTTAPWQHRAYDDPDGRRLAEAVPRLLGDYLARLGAALRLVHVGPAPLAGLAEALGPERYRFLPPLPAPAFRRALGSADLLLSLNVSATTIATAIVSSIPVVVVASSCDGADAGPVRGGRPPSEALARWIEGAAPLFPFWMWPLGFRRLLDSLLRANPYVDALAAVELLDEERVIAMLEALLFDRDARSALASRQADYVAAVERLPRAAEVIERFLEGRP